MIKNEYKAVKLIQLKENIGVAGWNIGLKRTSANYVLLLDDDASPGKDSIALSLKEFKNDPSIACIAFNVIDSITRMYLRNNWLPSIKNNYKVYWPVFVGCAAMFRADRISKDDFIPPDYFLYQHELPVSAQIYNSGYRILYNSEIIAFHHFKAPGYKKLNDIYLLKNNLRFINEYFPVYYAIYHSVHLLAFYLSRAIKYNWIYEYIKIALNYRTGIIKKKSISFEYYSWLKKLKIFDFNIRDKIINKRNTLYNCID